MLEENSTCSFQQFRNIAIKNMQENEFFAAKNVLLHKKRERYFVNFERSWTKILKA